MATTTTELRDFAKAIASGADECCRRACINRAYYAAFHALCKALEIVPGNDPGPNRNTLDHSEIPKRLRNFRLAANAHPRLGRYESSAKALARTFVSAMDAREEADYVLSTTIEQPAVDLQLRRMRELMDFAFQIANELERMRA